MAASRARTVRASLIAGLLLAGCASPPERGVRFQGLSDCPAWTPASLLNAAGQFGPASSTHALECALTVARETRDPTLANSALPARLALHLAERREDAPGREALAWEGVQRAEQALRQNRRDPAVPYYLAANLGLAVHDHPLEASSQIPRLEQTLRQAAQSGPGVDEGGPLRLLGMLYLKAPPWPTGIGDGDKALEWLNRAAREFPRHPLNHLFLAQALWEVNDDAAAARAAWTRGRDVLEQGQWGYNRAIWQREFDSVAREFKASRP